MAPKIPKPPKNRPTKRLKARATPPKVTEVTSTGAPKIQPPPANDSVGASKDKWSNIFDTNMNDLSSDQEGAFHTETYSLSDEDAFDDILEDGEEWIEF